MKFLKGRKLLKKPKQIESRRGKMLRKIKHILAEIWRRKMLIFNLIVLALVSIYAIQYFSKREDVKVQEAQEEQEAREQGERLRDIFFNTVYEEEMEERREQEEAEARRQASIAAATQDQESADQGQTEEGSGEPVNEEAETEEEAAEEEEEIIPVSAVVEKIEDEESSEFPTYRNSAYNYALQYPPNWYLDKATSSKSWLSYITSYDPTGQDRGDLPSSPRLEIFVQENVRGLSLKEWVEEGYQYYGEPESSEKINVAEEEAFRNVEINPYPAISVTMLHKNMVYTLTYTGGDITNEENVKIFDFMLQSFKFTDNNNDE